MKKTGLLIIFLFISSILFGLPDHYWVVEAFWSSKLNTVTIVTGRLSGSPVIKVVASEDEYYWSTSSASSDRVTSFPHRSSESVVLNPYQYYFSRGTVERVVYLDDSTFLTMGIRNSDDGIFSYDLTISVDTDLSKVIDIFESLGLMDSLSENPWDELVQNLYGHLVEYF